MSSLNECPNPDCGRKAENNFDSNWFPVHTCRDCGKKYCDECSDGGKCPKCGSSSHSDYDKVYS